MSPYHICHGQIKILHTRLDAKNACLKNSYNLGQKVGRKFTKLSKIGFSMAGWTTGYSPSNPSISGIFFEFPKSFFFLVWALRLPQRRKCRGD